MKQHEPQVLPLAKFMDRPEGWGRNQGREVYQRILGYVEDNPGLNVFRISMKGVRRMDISFASEAIVELAKRFRCGKGFCLIDLTDIDIIENIDAACTKKDQPMYITRHHGFELVGPKPSEGIREALEFTMRHSQTRASQFAVNEGISLANASMKLKKLWDQGFLLRREVAAETGGVEYVYDRIK